MKKLLFILTFIFSFSLVGCGSKSKQLKNKEISEEKFGEIFSLATSFHMGFVGLYYDEKTFTTDPEDSSYEIGYVFELTGESLDEEDENGDYYYKGSIDHYKVRRDKEHNSIVDSDYELGNDTSGNTYQIVYYPKDENALVKKGFYKITYKAYDEYGNYDFDTSDVKRITKDEAIDQIDLDFWLIPNDDIKIKQVTDSRGNTYNDYEITLKGEKEKAVFARSPLIESKDQTSFAVSIKNPLNSTKKELKLFFMDEAFYQKQRPSN